MNGNISHGPAKKVTGLVETGPVCEFGNIAGFETGFRWQHDSCEDGAVMETRPVARSKVMTLVFMT